MYRRALNEFIGFGQCLLIGVCGTAIAIPPMFASMYLLEKYVIRPTKKACIEPTKE